MLKNINVKKLVILLTTLFFTIDLPVLTLYCSELIVRQVLTMPFAEWRENYGDRFWVNVLLMIALFNVFYILPRKWFMFSGLVLSGLLLVFAFANKVKMEMRSSPISVEDFFLIDELTGFELPVEFNKPLLIGLGIVFIGLCAAIFIGIPKMKENWIFKGAAFLVSVFFLFMLWTDEPFSPMNKAHFENTWWKLEEGLMRNGVFGNFVNLAKQSNVEPPAGFSAKNLQSIAGEYQPAEGNDEEKPNVIFLMSESFIDPYFFGEQHFKKDPIPNFHKYFGESLHGKMHSPEFGGGTANVEFEALTGFSMQFMRADYVPYQLFVKKPLPSAAYAFREAGYDTTAIHSYFGWFYQRESVYKQLGFNRFGSGEFMDLDKPNDPGGPFPSDKHITDMTLETLDATGSIDFIHAVAAEGHVPYWQKEDSEFLKADTLPEETRKYLNFYTDKMHSIDAELGRLIESLDARDEPSILVFFGDHFPAFPNSNEAYGPEGTQAVEDMLNNYDDYLATHQVPYFIWQSEGNEPKEMDISPNQFGPLTLEIAGVKGNAVTAVLDRMREQGDAVIPYAQWEEQMVSPTGEMKDLQMIQYDLLHGKRYSENLMPDLLQAPSQDYHLGLYPEMNVRDVREISDQYEILVEGAPKFSKLIVDGEEAAEVEWQRITAGLASFTVSKDQIPADAELHMVVLNSNGVALKKTASFTVTSW